MDEREIYLAVNCGEVKFASYEESDVDEYIDTMNYRSLKQAAEDYGYDLDTERGEADAQYQAGYDGGLYEKAKVSQDDLDSDEEYVVDYDSGSVEVTSEDIEELLDISLDDALSEDDNDDYM